MSYTFFYVSGILLIGIFFTSVYFKGLTLSIAIIGIASVAYSLTYEIILGDQLKLYHYIKPKVSTLYMVLAGIFIYPLLNMLYLLYLPKGTGSVIAYTVAWIIAMFLFEFASFATKTVVLTGWKPFPWSILTYIFTYSWINLFYSYLERVI